MSKKEESCPIVKIDRCFVLTMSTDSARFKAFSSTYNLDIPLEPIIGVNTKKPENAEPFKRLVVPEKFNKMYLLDTGKAERIDSSYFNSGALGCYLGHIEFYKRCFDQNLNYAMIFEDNVVLKPEFKKEMSMLVLPPDFDMCFLHNWTLKGEPLVKCDQNFQKIKFVMGTKCYIINVKRMWKYFPLFFPIETHIDYATEKLIYHGANVYFRKTDPIHVVYIDGGIGHSNVPDKNDDVSPYFKINLKTLR